MRKLIRAAMQTHRQGKRNQAVQEIKNQLVEFKDRQPPYVISVKVQSARDVEDYVRRLKREIPELWVDEGLKELRLGNARVIFPKPQLTRPYRETEASDPQETWHVLACDGGSGF